MNLRIDLVTACRVDAAILLLQAITGLDATVMMAASSVPADVAARVLALPLERRPVQISESWAASIAVSAIVKGI